MEIIAYIVCAILTPFTITLFVYLFFKYKFLYWKLQGVKFSPPEFPYGHIKGSGAKFNIGEYVREYYFKFHDCKPFVGMYFFASPIALITDLDLAKNILIKDFNNFMNRGAYFNEKDDPMSAHIFNLAGDRWKILRSKLSPTFSSGKLKAMFPLIINVAKNLNESLDELVQIGGGEVEIKDLLARYTTDVIGTCAFGLECNCLRYPQTEFREKSRNVFEHPRNSELLRQFTIACPGLAKLCRIKTELTEASDFFSKIVHDTIEFRDEGKIKRNDFMDLLIQLKNTGTLEGEGKQIGNLTVDEIAAQAYLFFIAGFETSSAAMALSLYELAQNPEVQDKARQNIKEAVGDSEITYESLQEMLYLQRVLAETLRKYPAVFFLIRETINDYKIPNSNAVIKKGVKCAIPALAYHHDPEYFPNPERYDPDRFLPAEIAKRHSTAYLPFGDGPRICIGMRFAKTQSMIGLATLLRNYRFSICNKTEIPIKLSPKSLVLCVQHGIWLKIEKIK